MHCLKTARATLLITLGLYVVGASTFNVLPVLVEGTSASLHFSQGQIGALSFGISAGQALSAFLAGIWVRSVRWPVAALVSLVGMVSANVLSILIHSYWAFVFLQGMSGLCGGSLLCLTMTILSDYQESTRYFGIGNALQVLYQILGLLTGPTVLHLAGLDGILAILAVLSAGGVLVASFLPIAGKAVAPGGMRKALSSPATLTALIGCSIFFINAGAFWTYVELMGESHGISSHVVSNCIAAGVSGGVLGGLVAWRLGDRFGRLVPLTAASVMTVGAALILRGSFGVTSFLLSSVVYCFAWNYSLTYQLAAINAIDATGRGVALFGGFGNIGMAVGAALAGSIVDPGDYTPITGLMILAVCLSTALFVITFVARRGRPRPSLT
jgi:predicted MFS family arabinose efflux permease